jgi:hypothetical protein
MTDNKVHVRPPNFFSRDGTALRHSTPGGGAAVERRESVVGGRRGVSPRVRQRAPVRHPSTSAFARLRLDARRMGPVAAEAINEVGAMIGGWRKVR